MSRDNPYDPATWSPEGRAQVADVLRNVVRRRCAWEWGANPETGEDAGRCERAAAGGGELCAEHQSIADSHDPMCGLEGVYCDDCGGDEDPLDPMETGDAGPLVPRR